MNKKLLIDINAIISAGVPVRFHDRAISVISRAARDLGYSISVLLDEASEPDAFSFIQDIFRSEQVALNSIRAADSEAIATQDIFIHTAAVTAQAFTGRLIGFDGSDWDTIFTTLKTTGRKVSHSRITRETQISIDLDPDGTGTAEISTGLHFLDHMLDQIARHGGMDLRIAATGDLHIDEHHTMEDTAITLGEAFAMALGDKRGIERYGFCLPMDDALAQVAVDFGGRSWLVWDAGFKREKIGDVPTEMFYHFFKSFSDGARCNLNISVRGDNEHHKIEAIFKAFAKALKMAVRRDFDNMQLPSTKGVL